MKATSPGIRLNFGIELASASLEACLTRAYVSKADDPLLFDLSSARFINIDSLLFLLCVLNHLKRKGRSISLLLPEIHGQWDFDTSAQDAEQEKVRRVRDFLKRWHFEDALVEAVGASPSVLCEHQVDYFSKPLRFYQESRSRFETHETLLSSLLIEITHMTRGPVGLREVDESKIDDFVQNRALEKRFKQAVCEAVGRDASYFGKEFASTILREALINTFEHPGASLAMIALARGPKGHLTVGIADNGGLIPDTIADEFRRSPESQDLLSEVKVTPSDLKLLKTLSGSSDVEQAILDYKKQVAATVFATRLGTTSKKEITRERRGEGLYYVRTRANEFGGTCSIRTGSACVVFSGRESIPQYSAVSPWPGNLITIRLPLVDKQQ